MREIKFRAWYPFGNKWVTYGTAISGSVDYLQLDKETEGEFTGLQDSNGVDICEGDIVRYSNKEGHHTKFSLDYVIEFGAQDLGHSSYQQTIGWNATESWAFRKPSLIDSGRLSNGILSLFGYHKLEIIGNIHQNLELLEQV